VRFSVEKLWSKVDDIWDFDNLNTLNFPCNLDTTMNAVFSSANSPALDSKRSHLGCVSLRAAIQNLLASRLVFANGHTTLNAPVLVRSPKLSNVGPG
jgi:hypothetical protein